MENDKTIELVYLLRVESHTPNYSHVDSTTTKPRVDIKGNKQFYSDGIEYVGKWDSFVPHMGNIDHGFKQIHYFIFSNKHALTDFGVMAVLKNEVIKQLKAVDTNIGTTQMLRLDKVPHHKDKAVQIFKSNVDMDKHVMTYNKHFSNKFLNIK